MQAGNCVPGMMPHLTLLLSSSPGHAMPCFDHGKCTYLLRCVWAARLSATHFPQLLRCAVLCFVLFCADLHLCGVLLNKVGSSGHGVWLAEALSAAWQQQRLQKQIKVLGCIPKVQYPGAPQPALTGVHGFENGCYHIRTVFCSGSVCMCWFSIMLETGAPVSNIIVCGTVPVCVDLSPYTRQHPLIGCFAG